MGWRDLILDGYSRISQEVEKAINGLSLGELDWQPAPESNTIGWTVWHLARVQDAQIADLLGEPQTWIKDKWYVKFKRPDDARDTGFGDTPQQVAAFRSPEPAVLLGYLQATAMQSERYLKMISAGELERTLNEPWFHPLPTVAVRLVSILADGHQHVGEAFFIRGLMKKD